MKIIDFDILIEINNIEQSLKGYSLKNIYNITKDYKYYELIDKIFIRIKYESCYNNLDNFDKLFSYIDNKRKNFHNNINLPEFKWNGGELCLEEDFGIDINSNNYGKFRLDNMYYKSPSYKFILNTTLADWLYMLDYRIDIKNKDYNDILNFVESIPIVEEIIKDINYLYKDKDSNETIKEIEE